MQNIHRGIGLRDVGNPMFAVIHDAKIGPLCIGWQRRTQTATIKIGAVIGHPSLLQITGRRCGTGPKPSDRRVSRLSNSAGFPY
jgi:hypothetical protein